MRQAKQAFPLLLGVFVTTILLAPLYGQSVAELARKQRTRKTQEAGEAKVYTNEDVRGAQRAPAPAPVSAEAQPATGEQPSGAPAAGEQPAESKEPKEPPEKSLADLEKEYREKFAKLRETLDFEEKKLDVMQRELNLMRTQYYSNPQDTLTQEFTRSNINTRMQEIEAQKQTVEKAKQAIADLEEELRRNCLPPGWAR